MAIVYSEDDDPRGSLQEFASSEDPFEEWLKERGLESVKRGRVIHRTSATSDGAIICFGMPLYLVTMNLTRSDPLLPVDQLTQFVRDAILPSVESLARLQAQGKVVSGGYPIGRPAIVLLIDAHSEQELHGILKSLPLWEQVEAEITQMQGFKELMNSEDTV
jgi:muconolactone delta-isomerase